MRQSTSGDRCHPWQYYITRVISHEYLAPLPQIRRGKREKEEERRIPPRTPTSGLAWMPYYAQQGRWIHLSVWRSWKMMCFSQRMSWGPSLGACPLLTCLPRASWIAPSAVCSSSLSPTAVALGFDPSARKTRLFSEYLSYYKLLHSFSKGLNKVIKYLQI